MRTPNNESVAPDITAAPPLNKRANERTCILSGEQKPREHLMRLALSPDDEILPDPGAKAPGRGAWLGVSRPELENAIAKGQFKGALARAFKSGETRFADDLPEQIERALEKSLLQRLGLELRSGAVILGTAKIAEKARTGRVGLLLHASDASEDGRKKLDQAWRVGREIEGSGERGTVLPLDRTALSVALGRENVVHLALVDGGGAARIKAAVERLMHFSGMQDANETRGAAPIAEASQTMIEDVKDYRAR